MALGLAAMLGAGVFGGLAPAAGLAGRWLLVGIVIAVLPAFCSAVSTSEQARAFPGAGGGYRYTRDQLGRWPGRLAGGAYLMGRLAAMAAIAGCFGDYVLPGEPMPAAIGVLVFAVAADAAGLALPPAVVRLLVGFVLVVLGVVVAACFAIAPPPPTGLPRPAGLPGTDDPGELGRVAGVMFFAFLGFERVTALPAERRSRALLPVLLVVALGGYLAVGAGVLRQLGAARLALSPVPLRDAVAAADGAPLVPLVTAGALVALALALFMVVGGTRRTIDAMAHAGDLPGVLAVPRRSGGQPVAAAICVGAAGLVGVSLLRADTAVELGATCMLGYYAFTNAAARLLRREDRAWPARTACFGLGLCVVIWLTMPPIDLTVAVGAMVLGAAVAPLGAIGRRRYLR